MVERVWDSILQYLRRSYKMFIELSAPPSAPLFDLVLMPKRSQTEDWVDWIETSLAFLQTGVIDRENKAEMRKLFRQIEKLEGQPKAIDI